MSFLTRLLIQIGLTTILLWAMVTYLGSYVGITGGWPAYAVIAIVLTLLNMFVRPILDLVIAPIRFIFGLIGLIIVNGLFLWILTAVTAQIDPAIATFAIRGGVLGWIIVAIVLGIGKMLIHMLTPAKKN